MAGGRPRKVIEQEQFEKLCGIQCTKEEICAWFNASEKTLDRWVKDTYGQEYSFSQVFNASRQVGHISLRRKQFARAMEGSDQMLKWLGANYLKQSDKTSTTHEAGETVKKLVVNLG